MGRSNGQTWKVKCCLLLLLLLLVPLFYGCYCCCSCCCHMYLDTLSWHAPNHLGICPSRATIWRGIRQVNLLGKYNIWGHTWSYRFDQTYCQVATRNCVGFARTNRLGSGLGFACTHGPAFGRSGGLAYWGRSGPAAWLQGARDIDRRAPHMDRHFGGEPGRNLPILLAGPQYWVQDTWQFETSTATPVSNTVSLSTTPSLAI